MAFAIRNLSVLAYANGFTLWHYKAGKDRLDQVEKPDFFADAADMLAEGDMMMVSGAGWRPHPHHRLPRWRRGGHRAAGLTVHRVGTGRFSTSRLCRSDPASVSAYRPSRRSMARPFATSRARQGPSFKPAGRPAFSLSANRWRAERQHVSRYGSFHTVSIVGCCCQ